MTRRKALATKKRLIPKPQRKHKGTSGINLTVEERIARSTKTLMDGYLNGRKEQKGSSKETDS